MATNGLKLLPPGPTPMMMLNCAPEETFISQVAHVKAFYHSTNKTEPSLHGNTKRNFRACPLPWLGEGASENRSASLQSSVVIWASSI